MTKIGVEGAGDRVEWELKTRVADSKYLKEKVKEKKIKTSFIFLT